MIIRFPFKPALFFLLMTAAPAHAQELLLSADPMGQARAAEARRDPAEALSRYLRVLSSRPSDLDALIGAGRAALEIGDPSAAIGFYARAEEIAPRNGRIKAGLGSAMLQMENAKAALRLFDDAVDLGVAAADVAGDRGLAYDLRGDNRRAQQEYALALRVRDDSEIRRRLALSRAMSGDRAGALAVLDPLLRRQDVPAWRVRAFVSALTGDASGAEKTALAVMPRPQAMALLPFLAKLPGLKPQQQAAAVHFGHFPSDGRRQETELSAQASPTGKLVLPTPKPATGGADSGLIPSGAPLGRGSADGPLVLSEPVAKAPRRRPGRSEDRLASVMAGILTESPAAAEPIPEPIPAKPKPAPKSEPKKLAADTAKSKEPGKADAASKGKEAAKAKDGGKEKDAKAKTAERYWVQVAGGANKGDLPTAFAKLKEKSPKLFAGRSAWTTPLRATNRLLVGPFKTLGEAQEFVNRAGKESLSAFTYASPPGQDVEKLAVK